MSVRVAVAVSVTLRSRREIDDLAVSHASFGDDVVGEFLHFAAHLEEVDEANSWADLACDPT